MKNIKYLFFISLLFLLSCQSEQHSPLFPGSRPLAVTDFSVKNIPGGAKISVKGMDASTLYVKAAYTIKKGVTRVAKASKYNNVLLVNGFPESKDYTVEVYAVGGDEQISAPTKVTVHPLTPPYKQVLSDLTFTVSYGGGIITSDNKSTANLMIGVITKNDSTGKWYDVTKEYTNKKDINFAIRGFPPVKKKFGFYTRDQWLNFSDTIYQSVTPWEEVKIDFSNFQPTPLPGDAPANCCRPLVNIFDDVKGNWRDGFYSENVGVPQHITIKLPGTYVLSRFKLWQSMENPYGSSNPKKIRIWGSMAPNPDGSLDDSWYVLGVYDDWKPSGLPVDENSAEDIKVGNEGNEFTFPRTTQPAKYLRFETLETWQPRDRVYITELAFWGRKL